MEPADSLTIHHKLDIRQDICPLTFVKAKMLIDTMQPGETAQILLKGQEVLDNLPPTITEHHNTIISLEQRINNNQEETTADFYHILTFRKNSTHENR